MARRAKLAEADPDFDRRMMAAALRIGRRNMGQTHPNPAVGCVIVKSTPQGRIVIGRGVTAAGGRPHAERIALAEAGKAAKGATVYVTLEPCAHDRPDGSCTEALIKAGVARVVTALADPDPRTNGQGHAALEAAGIAVTTGVLAQEAARVHGGHIARLAKGRPYITLKLAVSADGMIGRREGERMIITGRAAFDAVQMMRTESDVVLVGIGTVLVDDPRLTVRLPGLAHLSPARVILDAGARLPPDGRLLQSVGGAPLFVFVGPEAPAAGIAAIEAAGATVVRAGLGGEDLDLAEMLRDLSARGYTRVLCEGGARVASSLLANDLLDEIVILRAPVVVGANGVQALGGRALSAIERSPRYRQVEAAVLGPDTLRRYLRAA